MPTVGEQLRNGRETRNLTQQEAAEALKMKTDQVRALEEGNYEVFSAPIYIRGFVRNYANLLKLDLSKVMETLDEELNQSKKFRKPPPLSGEREGILDYLALQLSRVNWKIASIVGGVLVVVVLGMVLISFVKARLTADPLADLSPGVYQPAQEPGLTLPLPTNAVGQP